MAKLFQIDGVNYTTINNPDMGQPGWTDAGWTKFINGERTTDADRTNRTISTTIKLQDTTAAAVLAKYNTLKASLLKPLFDLVRNKGGDDINKTYKCYGSAVPVEMPSRLDLDKLPEIRVPVEIEAEPFARGAAINLPRNWVKDALLCEDFNNDGICNSFSAHEDATPTTASRTINDGQNISVTTWGLATYYGIKLAAPIAVVAGESFCAAITWEALTGDDEVNIYWQFNDGASTKKYLVQGDSSYPDPETKVKIQNQIVPAGATTAQLYCEIAIFSGNGRNFTVKKAIFVRGQATLPVGADGNYIFWTSEVAESPATMCVDNLPGDENVDALAVMQFCNTSNRIGGSADPPDYLYVGMTSQIKDNVSLVKSFSGAGSDSECIGGVYGSANEWNPDTRIIGRGLLLWRTNTTSTSATTDTHQIKQHSDPDWEYFPAFISDKIKPFSTVGAGVWLIDNYGTFELPTAPNPDDNQLPTSLDQHFNDGSLPGALYNDYLAFMPTEQYIRAEAVLSGADPAKYLRIISDSISGSPNIRWQRATSGSVEFPFVGSGARHFTQPQPGEPLTLAQGSKKNTMLVCGARYDLPSTNYRHRKTGMIVATRIIPRFLD